MKSLQSTQSELDDRMEMRRKQFHVLVSSIHQLTRTPPDRRPDPRRCDRSVAGKPQIYVHTTAITCPFICKYISPH